MYEILIKEYIKKISIEDINDFAIKNNIPIKAGEDKIIYDFIKYRWKDVYNSNNYDFRELKGKISDELLNSILILYNKYKSFIK